MSVIQGNPGVRTPIAGSVPFVSLRRQHAELMPALRDAFDRVVGTSGFVLGEEVERFEEEFARYCTVRHCVGVASGTAAITLAALAAGLEPGDEVLVPAHTFIASALGVQAAGLVPVLCDVEEGTGLLDPAAAAAAVGTRTAAILAVHLYGQPADMNRIGALADRHGLIVLEDAAQAHGARWRGRRVGSLGRAAAFSFYPSKNLGALGDGGAICTDDPELARRARELRDLGRRGGRHVVAGANERLDGLQAALLRVKLSRLDRFNDARARLTGAYRRRLADRVWLPRSDTSTTNAHHIFPVRVPSRETVLADMRKRGIDARVHYPLALHQQPPLVGAPVAGPLPVAEAWAREELSLPLFPELTVAELEAVTTALEAALT